MTPKMLYIILFILAGAVVLLAFEVVVQHQEIKDLLGRRYRKDKPKPEQQAEEINQQEIRERHRAQASSDMAELNVFAAYYGGLKNE
ncbi:MAG: hypothetical protein K2I14_01960 [Eubacterium sp.]|nr:hypothetical protein [Eubacterium sp.]